MWEAPLTVMKMIPEKICSKPECCISVYQGLLYNDKDTRYTQELGQVL